MSIHQSEFGQLVDGFHDRHGGILSDLAALSHLTTYVFKSLAKLHGTHLAPLISVQRRAIDSLAAEYGYEIEDVTAAIDDLGRAARTASILKACEDDTDMPDLTNPSSAASTRAQSLLARVSALPKQSERL